MADVKLNILMLDDDPDVRELAVELISEFISLPFNVLEAEDGHEGLIKIRNQKFDLIIIELKLPKLDGMGIFKALPYIDAKFVPDNILILSSLVPPAKHKLTVGRVSHLRKPLLGKDFKEYVAKIFPDRMQE